MENTFTRGDLTKLAAMCQISRQHLTNILCGRREPRGDLPVKLQDAASMLGYTTSFFDWSAPHESLNPLFEKWRVKGSKGGDNE